MYLFLIQNKGKREEMEYVFRDKGSSKRCAFCREDNSRSPVVLVTEVLSEMGREVTYVHVYLCQQHFNEKYPKESRETMNIEWTFL